MNASLASPVDMALTFDCGSAWSSYLAEVISNTECAGAPCLIFGAPESEKGDLLELYFGMTLIILKV